MADKKKIESEPKPEDSAVADAAADGPQKPLRDPRVQMIIDHLWGPTGSVILHIIIVFILIKLVITPAKVQQADIEVFVVEPEQSKLEEFEKELEEIKDVQVDIKPPDAEMAVEQPPEVDNMSNAPQQEELAALEINTDAQSPLIMKGLFAGRSASGRASGLRGAGRWGGPVEAAILKALEWLKNHQEPDGSWVGVGGAKNKIAMTGMGLLTFLAHGETHTSEKYGPTVDKAIKYLQGQQQGGGEFGTPANNGGHGGKINAYANGIAAYAISEAYALTRIPSLRANMESAITYIIQGQQDTGGFTYGYEKNGRRDTSVAGWQTQALKAGYAAGADVPGLKEAMQKCVQGLKMNYDAASARFRYAPEPANPSNPSISMTPIGVLCMQLLGHQNADEVENAIKTMDPILCNWDEPGLGGWPMYAWYYMTQAKFHRGKSTWTSWNNTFAKEIVGHQNSDGSWTPVQGSEKDYGPVYGTTFSALTLMVYYRFLPTYKEIKVEAAPTEKKSDDVVVEIT